MPKGLMEKSIEMELLNSEINAAQRERAQETVDKLSAIMAEFRTAANHIRNDGRLSSAGQAADLADLKQRTDSRLAQVGDDRLASLDKRLAELQVLIRREDPAPDPALEFAKQAEARKFIMERYPDELELQAAYMEWAVSGGHDLAMRALEGAPLPLLSDPAVIETGKKTRGERTNTENAKTLRQLQRVRATIQATLNGYRTEIGLPDLTLEQVAQGEVAA